MPRGEKTTRIRDLNEDQLLELAKSETFENIRGEVVDILRERSERGTALGPRTFELVYPDAEERYTGKGIGVLYDTDGNETGIPLKELVARTPDGEEVKSSDYI